jgi:diguanylate cyclase (GGDEF)-like protein
MDESGSKKDIKKIMLVGDIGKAFFDAEAVSDGPYVIYDNVLDAINAAAGGGFSAVCVVMSGVSERLSSALKALRDSTSTKIFLLAQMYEEPIARQIVNFGVDGRKVADDYLICPMSLNSFCRILLPAEAKGDSRTSRAVVVDEKLQERMRLLERLATEDDLTGLKNRRYIWEFCRQILDHVKKEKGQVTLLVFDIDDFKRYNDQYGHSAGDQILRQAAVLIRHCCRAHDVVGRIGGDEFAVVFWDDPHRKAASVAERRSAMAEHPREVIFIARRFRKEMEKAEFDSLGPEGKGVLTISGGLAGFPIDGSAVEELFERADAALLEAKRSGKNRIYLVGRPASDIGDIQE